MKLPTHRPDPIPKRKAAYVEREPEALKALWDTVEYLSNQGIDIGEAGKAELEVRKGIKQKFPK